MMLQQKILELNHSSKLGLIVLCYERYSEEYFRRHSKRIVSDEFIYLLHKFFDFRDEGKQLEYTEKVLFSFYPDTILNNTFEAENFNDKWFFTREKYDQLKEQYFNLSKKYLEVIDTIISILHWSIMVSDETMNSKVLGWIIELLNIFNITMDKINFEILNNKNYDWSGKDFITLKSTLFCEQGIPPQK